MAEPIVFRFYAYPKVQKQTVVHFENTNGVEVFLYIEPDHCNHTHYRIQADPTGLGILGFTVEFDYYNKQGCFKTVDANLVQTDGIFEARVNLRCLNVGSFVKVTLTPLFTV